jgi:hypothetical protein
MFGLVKIYSCSLSINEKKDYLSLYCGTCKSIARLYGQSPRLYLNSDVVFLAGILKDSSPEDGYCESAPAGKCFSLPDLDSIPEHLKFAAYANAMLAYMTLEDKILDEKNVFKKIPYQVLRSVQKRKLSPVKDDLYEFRELMQTQLSRENDVIPVDLKSLSSRLEYYSEVTEKMILLTMKKSGIPGNDGLSLMFSKFGRILYVLDALEDFDEDQSAGNFNALQASLETVQLEKGQCEMVLKYLYSLYDEIAIHIDKVILSAGRKDFYKEQLYKNLLKRLNPSGAGACNSDCKRGKPGISWRDKWKQVSSFLETRYQNMQANNRFLIEIRRAVLSVTLMLLPYPLWASGSGDEPGICAQCLGAVCLLYCCCSKDMADCRNNCCLCTGLSCCCCCGNQP